MSNKQQTAVEWLKETMLKPLSKWPDDIWEQAKEMEKEQIKNAHLAGQNSNDDFDEYESEVEYYNETYADN